MFGNPASAIFIYKVFCIIREAKFHKGAVGVRGIYAVWHRVLARTLEKDPNRDAAILWDRTILSPSKFKTVGNIMCIRAHTRVGFIILSETRRQEGQCCERCCVFSRLVCLLGVDSHSNGLRALERCFFVCLSQTVYLSAGRQVIPLGELPQCHDRISQLPQCLKHRCIGKISEIAVCVRNAPVHSFCCLPKRSNVSFMLLIFTVPRSLSACSPGSGYTSTRIGSFSRDGPVRDGVSVRVSLLPGRGVQLAVGGASLCGAVHGP